MWKHTTICTWLHSTHSTTIVIACRLRNEEKLKANNGTTGENDGVMC